MRFPLLHRLLGLAVVLASAPAQANFSFAITPPRFELVGKPGERLRQVIEITNAGSQPSSLLVRTADWDYAPDQAVLFHDDLKPGSCRPWVAIERRELLVAPGRPYRFRFEVTPPAGQTPVECRFAIMLEGKDAAAGPGTPPTSGRVAVIVYVAVGGVQPELSVTGARVEVQNGRPAAVLAIRNTGQAHGRLDGFLTATDARGREFDVTPTSTPILPGETRGVAMNLSVKGDPNTAGQAEFPIVIKGKLEWGRGRSTDIQQRFER